MTIKNDQKKFRVLQSIVDGKSDITIKIHLSCASSTHSCNLTPNADMMNVLELENTFNNSHADLLITTHTGETFTLTIYSVAKSVIGTSKKEDSKQNKS